MTKSDSRYNYEHYKDVCIDIMKRRNDIFERWWSDITSNAEAILELRGIIEEIPWYIRQVDLLEMTSRNKEDQGPSPKECLEIELHSAWLDIIEIASRNNEDHEFLSKERLKIELRSAQLDIAELESSCKGEKE